MPSQEGLQVALVLHAIQIVAREQGAKRIALESSAANGDSRRIASCRTAAPERMQLPAKTQLARRNLRFESDF